MDSDSQKTGQDKQSGDAQANEHKKPIDWKEASVIAGIFTIIETVSVLLWQQADEYTGFAGFFLHWVSKCGLLAGAAFVAHKISKRPIAVWVGYCFLCEVMLLLAAYRITSQPPERMFTVRAKNRFITKREGGTNRIPVYWYLYSSTNGMKMSPILGVMYVEFTNTKSRPYIIDSYHIEARLSNGTWKPLASIDPRIGVILSPGKPRFTSGNTVVKMDIALTNASIVRLGTEGFDNNIERKRIPPEEMITGWMFFETPDEKFKEEFRFHATTTTGEQGTEPIVMTERESSNDVQTTIPTLEFSGETNISSFFTNGQGSFPIYGDSPED